MEPRNLQRLTVSIFIILSFLLLSILVIDLTQRDLSPDDTSAIYGGKLETGYPEIGYMTAFEDESSIFTCGVTFLSNDLALTAAHCIKQNSTIYVGENQFKLEAKENIEVLEATQHPSWDGENRNFDLALMKLEKNDRFTDFAEITKPAVGCNYEIVGYGGTEVDQLLRSDQKIRKSYEICIDAATSNLLYISGPEGGVCFGDSGSPIIEKNTNKIVGVLSAVFPSEQDPNVFCEIGNNAVAVRLDGFLDFINLYKTGGSGNSALALCGESCINSKCSANLSCNISKICELSGSNSCIAANGEFCSTTENIGCGPSSSCILNKCVKKTSASGNLSSSVFEGNLTENLLGADRGTLILIILLLLLIDFILILLVSIRRLITKN